MKYLQNARLEHLGSALCSETGNVEVQCKLESYSCKMTSDDKRQLKVHSQDAAEFQALSPPQAVFMTGSPVTSSSWQRSFSDAYNSGSLPVGGSSTVQRCDVRTLYHLIATLNASFQPDYDFSNAKSQDFSREPSFTFVASSIAACMAGSRCEQYTRLGSAIWKAVGDEIDLNDCDIYSYNPDLQSDPYSEAGFLWSFNYFFFDTKLKRIVFFSCRAASTGGQDDSADFDDRSSADWSVDDLMMEY